MKISEIKIGTAVRYEGITGGYGSGVGKVEFYHEGHGIVTGFGKELQSSGRMKTMVFIRGIHNSSSHGRCPAGGHRAIATMPMDPTGERLIPPTHVRVYEPWRTLSPESELTWSEGELYVRGKGGGGFIKASLLSKEEPPYFYALTSEELETLMSRIAEELATKGGE